MRYLAIKEEKKEFSAVISFFLATVLTIAVAIPAIILTAALGVEQELIPKEI